MSEFCSERDLLSFFMLDDQFTANRKPRSLVEMILDGRMEGLAAIGAWALAGVDCKASGSDGVVKRADLIRLLLDREIVDQLGNLLVDAGLWHAVGHDCPRCPAVAEGTWLFHDWFALGYTPAVKERENTLKRKELKDTQLIAEVWARDCVDPADPTVAACRYCGTVVKKKDTRSASRPHLDHVDPNRAIGVRNIVVACSDCNQRKGNRTPQQAGMTLLPPPRPELAVQPTAPHPTAAGPVSTKHAAAGPLPGNRLSEPAKRAVDTEPAQSTAGSQVDQDPDQTLDQPGTSPKPPPDHLESTVPARVRAGARARNGLGDGLGRGVGKGGSDGLPATSPTDRSPRKRRRRGRGGRGRGGSAVPDQTSNQHPVTTNPPPPRAPDVLDAGAPPPGVETPGRFGSPYKNWTGPPADVPETDCTAHGLPEPCWKCASGTGE